MRAPRFAVPVLTAALLLGAGVASTSSPAAAQAAPKRAPAVASAPAPFARVYLALRGCTSCSHCRTTIRQMTKGSAKGGETRVSGDQVEVLYATPRVVPLREVIRSLADNRLHDLSLVDVLFEAKGAIAKGADGALSFTLAETGQAFRVTLAEHLERPADGSPVRLVAMVDGWRGKGGLTLVARELRTGA